MCRGEHDRQEVQFMMLKRLADGQGDAEGSVIQHNIEDDTGSLITESLTGIADII